MSANQEENCFQSCMKYARACQSVSYLLTKHYSIMKLTGERWTTDMNIAVAGEIEALFHIDFQE